MIDQPEQPKVFEVEPDAWPVVQLFVCCQTQWRTGPSGLIGLDYNAVKWAFSLYDVEDQQTMLEDLQIMESEILVKFAQREG